MAGRLEIVVQDAGAQPASRPHAAPPPASAPVASSEQPRRTPVSHRRENDEAVGRVENDAGELGRNVLSASRELSHALGFGRAFSVVEGLARKLEAIPGIDLGEQIGRIFGQSKPAERPAVATDRDPVPRRQQPVTEERTAAQPREGRPVTQQQPREPQREQRREGRPVVQDRVRRPRRQQPRTSPRNRQRTDPVGARREPVRTRPVQQPAGRRPVGQQAPFDFRGISGRFRDTVDSIASGGRQSGMVIRRAADDLVRFVSGAGESFSRVLVGGISTAVSALATFTGSLLRSALVQDTRTASSGLFRRTRDVGARSAPPVRRTPIVEPRLPAPRPAQRTVIETVSVTQNRPRLPGPVVAPRLPGPTSPPPGTRALIAPPAPSRALSIPRTAGGTVARTASGGAGSGAAAGGVMALAGPAAAVAAGLYMLKRSSDAASDSIGPLGRVAVHAVAAINPIAGMLAGPIIRKITAFGNHIEAETNRLAGYSPELAFAQGRSQIREELSRFREARRLGPELARFEDARSRTAEAVTKANTEIKLILLRGIETFLPLFERLITITEATAGGIGVLGESQAGIYDIMRLDISGGKEHAEQAVKQLGDLLRVLRGEEEPDPGMDPFFEQLFDTANNVPRFNGVGGSGVLPKRRGGR